MTTPPGGRRRPPTDAMFEVVGDPSANVYRLAETAILRQDDLRAAESLRWSEAHTALTDLMNVKFDSVKESTREARAVNDAALGKADHATGEKIAKLEQLVTAQVSSLNEKVDDEKQSLATTRLELAQTISNFRQETAASLSAIRSELVGLSTRRATSSEDRNDRRAGANLAIAAAGVIVAVLVAAFGVYSALKP